jgi:hypothetical protein
MSSCCAFCMWYFIAVETILESSRTDSIACWLNHLKNVICWMNHDDLVTLRLLMMWCFVAILKLWVESTWRSVKMGFLSHWFLAL